MADFEKKNRANMARDSEGSRAYLTTSEFQLDYCMKEWPGIAFIKTREINA
jgi:peptide chain release factor 3